MSNIIYLVIGLVVGYVGGRVTEMRAHRAPHKIVNPEQVAQHKENLDKVLGLIEQHGELSNDIVENALGVSNSTAERYLQELEGQGKLIQIGTIGQNVRYKKA